MPNRVKSFVMLRSFPKDWRFLLVIGAVVAVGYWPIFLGFFQQDEWLAFGFHFLAGEEGTPFILRTAFLPRVSHYNPFNFLVAQGFFSVFQLYYKGYAAVSLILHLASVFLVYFLAKLVFQNRRPAFLTALLFGITAASFQATAWVFANLGTHGATIFGLLSLILFFLFLQKGDNRYFWISLALLVVSLLFKEITIGLFVILPLVLFVFGTKGLAKKRYSALILLVGFSYFLFRVVIFLAADTAGSIYSQDVVVTASQSPTYILYNLLSFPFKAVSQTVVLPDILFDVSRELTSFLPPEQTGLKGTTEFDLFALKVVEAISFLIFSIIVFLVLKIWKKEKGKGFGKIVVFGIAFVVLNSFVFALAPERFGIISIIDSRNLYFVSFGTAVSLVSLAFGQKSRKNRGFLAIGLLFLLNIFWLQNELAALNERGNLRQQILKQIKNSYPVPPQRVVFYTESDSSYYGLPPQEKILPFQSGFGHTLLIWYYPQEHWPSEFLKDRFLWEITEEGYREVEGRGFGYFRDFEILAETVKEMGLSPESIIAFRYNSEDKSLTDISAQTRERLLSYNSQN